MKITFPEIDTFQNAILAISELQSAVVLLVEEKDGKKTERTEQRKNPIVVSSRLSYALRRNLAKCEQEIKHLQNKRTELIKLHSQDGKIDLNQEQIEGQPNAARKAFFDDFTAFKKGERELEFFKVTAAAFDLDKNNIPVALLNDLAPMILEDEPAETPAQ